MVTLHKLETLEEIMEEGFRMHNALQMPTFTIPMMEEGTEIYSFRDSNGTSVANIAVDKQIVTNIVGPANEPISQSLLEEIKSQLSGIAVIRTGHEYGGERMVGTARSEEELEEQLNPTTH